MATEDQGYVDTTYLDAVQRLLSHLKRQTYERMHLEEGHSALDAGCGPGTDTIALATVVGPAGRVVGVDHDAEMVAEADRRARQAGVAAGVSHQRADVLALPFPDGSFDASPVDAERRLVRCFAEQVLVNGYSGRQLRRLFGRQGMADVSVEVYGVPFTDYAVARQTMVMDRWERAAVGAGVVSAEEVQALRACWEEADADGSFFASMSMVLVSGRKP